MIYLQNFCENSLREFKHFSNKHKKEILIAGIVMSILGGSAVVATMLSEKSFFIIQIAYAGWVGVTGLTQAGHQFIYGTCMAIAGLAIMIFSCGYMRIYAQFHYYSIFK